MNTEPKTPEPEEGRERDITVLHSRSFGDLPRIQADLVGSDARVADLFLRFVRETAGARDDHQRLMDLIADFTFLAFPQATHLVLVVRDEASGGLRPLVAKSRSGDAPSVALSSTLVRKVLDEGMSLVFTRTQAETASESIVTSGIKTAICAPLTGMEQAFGIIQLDIRGTNKGTFSRKDVDRITVFAHHVALVLDNHRLHMEQRKAFESTIDALVHSLSLKDPDTATHSVRVRDVAVQLGLRLGLTDAQIEPLRVAALLHDMGKHGVRDEVLFKPGRLSEPEREEMMGHTELTQNILDRIFYPAPLKDVPQLAAYHHEKMNGSGPFKIPGNSIPIQSRIISVADAFDALVSARVYKKALPPEQVLAILDQGRDLEWDGKIVDCLKANLAEIVAAVYVDDSHTRRAA